MNPNATETEAATIARIARASETPTLLGIEKIGVPLLILRENVQSLERLLPQPSRPRATVTLRDHESFIRYVNAHKTTSTTIFAELSETGGAFTAIIDYHEAQGPQSERAHWGEHVCRYVCEFTPEWKRWTGISGKGQNQTAMALFVEDNLFDIVQPVAAQMLEVVKSLEATSGVEFKSAIRLDNGDRQLNYAHTTTAKAGQQGDIAIPDRITLRLPIFTNGAPHDVSCRFRYTIRDGALTMQIEVERAHKLIDAALAEARAAITAAVELPVLLGSGTIKGA